MKQGIRIEELAAEVRRQRQVKSDYVADTRKVEMVGSIEAMPKLVIEDVGEHGITEVAQHQIAEKLGIPIKYYTRMLAGAQPLLADNVNWWFRNNPEKRLLRILDGDVRAFLSDRYRPLDNDDLAEAVLPTLVNFGATVHSCHITERRMYIKAVIDQVQKTVPPPEGGTSHGTRNAVTVSPGIVISNSEVGLGKLSVQPAVHFLSCTNMAVWARHAFRQIHLGQQIGGSGDDGRDVWEYLSDDTKTLTDASFWATIRDVVERSLDGTIFDTIIGELRAARGEPLEDPVPTVEKLASQRTFTVDEHDGVLKYLVEGGDLTKFGLANAVTRFSQDIESYDRASEFEEVGGEIMVMDRSKWRSLVN